MSHPVEYLPLGSVVLLKGGIKKIIVVARGLQIRYNNENKFFDYGGAQYPNGIMGDQLAYFNHDGIAKVIFKGYSDDDDKIIVENINRYLSANEVDRIDQAELEKAGTKNGFDS